MSIRGKNDFRNTFSHSISVAEPPLESLKFEYIEPTPVRLYIGQIPKKLTDEEFKSIVSICGDIKSWRRLSDPFTKEPKPFAFCEFGDCEGAQICLALLNKKRVLSQHLVVRAGDGQMKSIDDYKVLKLKFWAKKQQLLKKKKEEKEKDNPRDLSTVIVRKEDVVSLESTEKKIYTSILRQIDMRIHRIERPDQYLGGSETAAEAINNTMKKYRDGTVSGINAMDIADTERRVAAELRKFKDRSIIEQRQKAKENKEKVREERNRRRLEERESVVLRRIRHRVDREKERTKRYENREWRKMEDFESEREKRLRLFDIPLLKPEFQQQKQKQEEEEEEEDEQQKKKRLVGEKRKRIGLVLNEYEKKKKIRRILGTEKKMYFSGKLVEGRPTLKKTRVEMEFEEMETGKKGRRRKKKKNSNNNNNSTNEDEDEDDDDEEEEEEEEKKKLSFLNQKDLEHVAEYHRRTKEEADLKRSILDPRTIISKIPKDRNSLFSTKIPWDRFDKYYDMDEELLSQPLEEFVRKKVKEYLGMEEKSLVYFIMSKLKIHVTPDELLDELKDFLKDVAEEFVMRLWQMMLYYLEKAEKELRLGNLEKTK